MKRTCSDSRLIRTANNSDGEDTRFLFCGNGAYSQMYSMQFRLDEE